MGIIKIPSYIKKLANILLQKTEEVYLVGGCVRDSILKLPIKDYDLTTILEPKELKELFYENNLEVINNNGEKHGTISVVIDNNVVEITTFREDINSLDHRHPEKVVYTKSIETDLKRRDLTINALAYKISENRLIDLVGGYQDIINKRIRTVGDPSKRFDEDYLRILRALRFSSKLGFKIEEETSKAIHNQFENLKYISMERIQSELKGILLGNNVLSILLEYPDVIGFIIPPLKKCQGFMQNNKWHKHQDIYEHIAHVVSLTKPDMITRMSALLHDIGKPLTYSQEIVDGKVNGHFYGHAEYSRLLAVDVLTNLKFSNKETEQILFLIGNHDYTFVESAKAVKKLLLKIPNMDFDLLLKLLDLRNGDRSDHVSVKPESANLKVIENIARNILETKSVMSLKQLAINGFDVMGLGFKGPDIGQILKDVLNKIIDGDLINKKDGIINYINNNYKNCLI